jgi:hypothetical protein
MKHLMDGILVILFASLLDLEVVLEVHYTFLSACAAILFQTQRPFAYTDTLHNCGDSSIYFNISENIHQAAASLSW